MLAKVRKNPTTWNSKVVDVSLGWEGPSVDILPVKLHTVLMKKNQMVPE